MAFTKRPIYISRLEKVLEKERIEEIDHQEIRDVQEVEQRENEKLNLLELKRENPIRGFLSCYPAMMPFSLLICGFGLFFFMGFSRMIFGLFGLLLASLACLLAVLIARQRKHWQSPEWQESPFEDFKDEYRGEIAGKIPCVDTACTLPLYKLTVEHHQNSLQDFSKFTTHPKMGSGTT